MSTSVSVIDEERFQNAIADVRADSVETKWCVVCQNCRFYLKSGHMSSPSFPISEFVFFLFLLLTLFVILLTHLYLQHVHLLGAFVSPTRLINCAHTEDIWWSWVQQRACTYVGASIH